MLEVQAVQVDFSVHFVNGAPREVGLQAGGKFSIFILGRQVQVVWPDVVEGGQEVKGRRGPGSIEAAVQCDGAVDIVQDQFSVESALFVLSVQRNVLVGILAVFDGSNQSFHCDLRVVLLPMVSVNIKVERDFSQFAVVGQASQVEIFSFQFTGVSETVFLFADLDIRVQIAQTCLDAPIGDQVGEVAG